MKDRFDLEQEIMQIMSFKEIVDTLVWRVMDSVEPLSEDRIANALIGLSEMLDHHNVKMLDTLSQCFRLNDYRQQLPETKAPNLGDLLRQKLDEGALDD
jgi:hypothetical protein